MRQPKTIQPALLATALLASLAVAGSALANPRAGTFDDRWYVSGGAGANIQDSSRDTENTPTYTLGVGKFINPDWSVDLELNHQNPKLNPDEDLNWSQYGVSLDARRHWRSEGRAWNPYVLMGVGYGRSEEEFNNFPNPDSPGERKDGYPTAKLGGGVQGDYERFSLRGELYARASFDNDSILAPNESVFYDGIAQISVLVPLGAPRLAQARPAPQPSYDSGNEYVTSPTVYPDQPTAAIELPAAYFDFDQSTLTSQGRQALDEAARILKDRPNLRAEVTGHTDSKGTSTYNQGLSERRAQAAYDYLVNQGVDSRQLDGPRGYGENQPIAPNTHADGSDNPEGRAKNRRAEVNPVE